MGGSGRVGSRSAARRAERGAVPHRRYANDVAGQERSPEGGARSGPAPALRQRRSGSYEAVAARTQEVMTASVIP
jgi:hypothetical protein